jgi:hypothetical protein
MGYVNRLAILLNELMPQGGLQGKRQGATETVSEEKCWPDTILLHMHLER